jgi:hypothetical protein
MNGRAEVVRLMLEPSGLKPPPRLPQDKDIYVEVADEKPDHRPVVKEVTSTKRSKSSDKRAHKKKAAEAHAAAEAHRIAEASKHAEAHAKSKARGKAKGRRGAQSPVETTVGEDAEHLIRRTIERRLEVVKKLPSTHIRHLLREADKTNNTALQLAVLAKHTEIVQVLLEANADPCKADHLGNTSLHVAVMSNQEQVVGMLLEAGCPPAFTNLAGKTAKECADDPHIRGMIDKFEVTKTLPESVHAGDKALAPDNRGGSKARPTFRVRIENLPTKSTCDILEEQIRSLFKTVGAANPLRVEVVMDVITSKPKGFAYVDFSDAAAADLCVTGDGSEIGGNVVHVNRETGIVKGRASVLGSILT